MRYKMHIDTFDQDSLFSVMIFACPGRATMLDAGGEKAERARVPQNRTPGARDATKTRI